MNYAKPGIGGQLLGDCHRPSLPNKFGTNPQAESGKRLTAAALRDDDLRTPPSDITGAKKNLQVPVFVTVYLFRFLKFQF